VYEMVYICCAHGAAKCLSGASSALEREKRGRDVRLRRALRWRP
jgi:hypothetical protein